MEHDTANEVLRKSSISDTENVQGMLSQKYNVGLYIMTIHVKLFMCVHLGERKRDRERRECT